VIVFATDFGPVKAGPLVSRYMEELQYVLDSKSKRTKAYKDARKQWAAVEQAVQTIALVCWECEDHLRTTP
jgi:hypothetical protein